MGYEAANSYVLEQRQPDAIEIHREWTSLLNFEASPVFLARYRPVYVDGIRMFLTRKAIADINPSRLTEKAFDSNGQPDNAILPNRDDMRYASNDYALNRDFGTYLILH